MLDLSLNITLHHSLFVIILFLGEIAIIFINTAVNWGISVICFPGGKNGFSEHYLKSVMLYRDIMAVLMLLVVKAIEYWRSVKSLQQ
jgi:hypothetical protein